MSNSTEVIQITPNVVVSNSDTRRKIGIAFWLASFAAGVASLLFLFFPELAFGTDIPTRAVAFVNATVSLATGAFGFAIVLPNTPKQKDAVPVLTSVVAEVQEGNTPTYDPGSGAYG